MCYLTAFGSPRKSRVTDALPPELISESDIRKRVSELGHRFLLTMQMPVMSS